MHLGDLPLSVRVALANLGRRFETEGVHLFVFGSFARGDARPSSDLDIAVEWRTPPDACRWQVVEQGMEKLPTIRPVDLVDLRYVSPAFALNVKNEAIPLTAISVVG